MPITSEEEEDDETPLHSSADNNNPSTSATEEDSLPLSSPSDLSSSESAHNHSSDSDSDSDSPLPLPLPFSQHTFAPPFYGRPPTPLPPSPSLTSLLRPSRPTTPDQSDDDGTNPNNPTDPLPRASPKVPTYEYYGFVLYLFSSLCFLIYLLWSYLPSPFLHALGIYYYPNRWWSLAIPSFLVMCYVYIYVALAAYNLEVLTLGLGSVEAVTDEASKVAAVDGKGRLRVEGGKGRRERGDRERRRGMVKEGGGLDWREVWNEGTDAVMDVPLAGVCEVLYGEGREADEEMEDGDGDGGITVVRGGGEKGGWWGWI